MDSDTKRRSSASDQEVGEKIGRSRLSRSSLKWVKSSVKNRVSIYSQENYERLADLAHIGTFMMNGLNVDLNQDIDDDLDGAFFKRLIWSAFINGVMIVTTATSAITWSNSSIAIYVGNFLLGTGIPRELSIFTFSCAIFSNILTLMTSMRVIAHDPHLWYVMDLVKVISGSNNNLHRGMNLSVILKLKEDVRPLVASLRFLMRGIYAPYIAGFVINFGCLTFIDTSNATSWKVVLNIVWSLWLAIFIDQLFWAICASVLVTFITYKLFESSIERINHEINGRSIEVPTVGFFFHQLDQMMYILYFIRRYNGVMRIIIGPIVTFLISIVVYVCFACFFLSIPKHLLYVFYFYLPIFIASLMFLLSLIAKFSSDYGNTVERLFKISVFVSTTSKIGRKLNYILDEMRYENSFDCFSFIPQIKYIFVVQVRLLNYVYMNIVSTFV